VAASNGSQGVASLQGDVASSGSQGGARLQVSDVVKQGPSTISCPRVGEVDHGVAWIGGSNLIVPYKAKNITCYRPIGFKDRQKLEDSLRAGISADRQLEICGKTTVMVFTNKIKIFIKTLGENYLPTDWGQVKLNEVRDLDKNSRKVVLPAWKAKQSAE